MISIVFVGNNCSCKLLFDVHCAVPEFGVVHSMRYFCQGD